MDSDQNVQEASCDAFTVFVECMQPEKLLPLLNQALDAIGMVINIYTGDTQIVLLDAIGQIGEQIKEELKTPGTEAIRNQLFNIVREKWNRLFEEEDIIFREKHVVISLFECFQSIVAAFGLHIEPFALTILKQCCKIFQKFITLVKDDNDYLISEGVLFQRAIDLVSVLFNAFGQRSQ